MSKEYTNPILAGDYPDPSILRVGDDYYLTHSSFNWAPGLLIWHSRNLIDWRALCFALTEYDGNVWAPELIIHDGKFFIYYKTTGGNHVVVADAIIGPWSKPYNLDLPYIDPGHVVGPDGKRYLHLSAGTAAEISADGLSSVSRPEKVYDGWPIPEDWNIEGFCLEGPKLFQKDGYYYLVSAEGGTAGPATSHMVIVARSKGPLGPWENAPNNPLIHTESREETWWSCGHGTLFEGPDKQWYCIYHAYEKGYYNLGRQTLMEPIIWNENGWPETVEPDRAFPMPRPDVAPTTHGMSQSDDFNSNTLGPQWRFWGEFNPARFQVGKGELKLQAQGDGPSTSSPLSIITGAHAYEIEVEITTSEDAEAGLMLFYNEHNFEGLSFGNGELRYLIQGKRPPSSAIEGLGQNIKLKMVNDNHEVKLYFTQDGNWKRLPKTLEVSGLHHNVLGGFLSLRPALFAFGEGETIFRNFKYKQL